MTLSMWQILLITLYISVAFYDGLNTGFGLAKPVIAGAFVGLLLGDLETGLIVGGTMNLIQLGASNYGGASIPDYLSGTILGTAFAIMTGKGVEVGVGLAIPIALLLTQLDVLARFANTFFQHKADQYAEEGKFDSVARMNLMGLIPWTLSRAVPVFLGLYFGADKVKGFVDFINKQYPWVLTDMKVVAGMLPALGIAILLRYLSINKYFAYLVIGFISVAFLKISVLGVALIGLALALIVYNRKQEEIPVVAANGGVNEDE
ncbi:PTS system, mannose-specific IIC component [Clostridium cavendishii DSM 21758]|uniref:PTS system, mannose-specific IIC component n=1 Tax=Clostridium cavendishii DSM 21758 TaxID=1121302 RepID=A0A1M6URP4_9CLOT|nr:PTS sugar transporter subunit IIC [Clostridium cavendishii]SHK71887.1 PTS system, mannose-specific IIC component [Clostridium cavendishii DSM 21758]